AEAGRTTAVVALGLAGVLLVSGVIEAFVTPSGLPTWSRITIGVAAFLAFVGYVVVLGGRGVRAGFTGDTVDLGDVVPVA
ncbi:MAG: stage II sporulation protein M, partial [Jatrophihabitans sp.]